MTRLRPVLVDALGVTRREMTLVPDADARALLATRMGLPAIHSLVCRFSFARNRQDEPIATGTLDAVVVQEDVTTLDPFHATIHEAFQLRFVPAEELTDALDPDDPVDDVAYQGATVDLEEVMAEQLALALDPYPHAPSAGQTAPSA